MKIFNTINLSYLTLFLLATSVPAAESPADATKAAAQTPTKGQWDAIQAGTGGVTVDRSNGDVYVIVTGEEIFKGPGEGVWKSTDQGRTFARVDGGIVGGRCETGYALCLDPNGKRLYCFMLDGSSGCTLDAGQTWEKLGKVNRGWDFAAVDWSVAKPQVIFGSEHESGGKYHLSSDGGKSWKKLGEFPKDARGTFGVGVIDANTLVRWSSTQAAIERSLDAGTTWTKVSDEVPLSHVMVVFKGVGYWIGQKGLVVSKDKGATWTLQGQPVPQAAWGPYFGKDEKHIVVAGKSGVHETTDGGEHWSLVAALPDPFKNPPGPGWYLNFAFDPVNNLFYASWMGKPTYRYTR